MAAEGVTLETHELVTAIGRLRSYGPPGRPSRHQAILLLWAFGRARQSLPRLARWSQVRRELAELLTAHGLAESAPTPEFPFVALARTPLWEVAHPDVPAAHGSGVLPWLNSADPMGGLTEEAYDLVASDDVGRAEAVGALLNRYFAREPGDVLLRTVGLYSAGEGSTSTWDLQIGDIARRQVIHQRFGGQRQGRISTPANSKLVMLWPNSMGSSHGYDYDGWKTDGSYHYTGQGRSGDQGFTANNQALLDKEPRLRAGGRHCRSVCRAVRTRRQ